MAFTHFSNRLTEAFLSGHLYLNEKPDPRMLALPNPLDPVANVSYRLHDAVLHNGKYYVYQGPAPVLTLFLPYALLTRNGQLNEAIGGAIFAVLGVIFSWLAWFAACRALRLSLPYWIDLAAMIALMWCQTALYDVRTANIYEVNVLAGFCFTSAAVWLTLSAVESSRTSMFLLAGLAAGLAVGSRPHLLFMGAALTGYLFWLVLKRQLRLGAVIAFASPFIACGILLACYNYARFGAFLEFGISRMVTIAWYLQKVHLSVKYIPVGLYYMLLHPPEFTRYFPYVEPVTPAKWITEHPPEFFIESLYGYLSVCPLAVLGLIAPLFVRRALVVALWAATLTIILFIASTGWAEQRYELDFAPVLLLVSLLSCAALYVRFRIAKPILVLLLALTLAYSLGLNLIMSIAGHDDWMRIDQPDLYAKVYRTVEHRSGLMTRPGFDITFEINLPTNTGKMEPLLVSGVGPVATGIGFNLVVNDRAVVKRMQFARAPVLGPFFPFKLNQPYLFRAQYDPATATLRVWCEGNLVMEQNVVLLPAAPEEIRLGVGDYWLDMSARFSGTIVERSRRISGS